MITAATKKKWARMEELMCWAEHRYWRPMPVWTIELKTIEEIMQEAQWQTAEWMELPEFQEGMKKFFEAEPVMVKDLEMQINFFTLA